MADSNLENIYEPIDEFTETIQEHMNETYLDSLIIALEAIFYGELPESLNGQVQEPLSIPDISNSKILDIRKSVQLAVLKGMKGATQQQHLMTPETVALFVGYLAEKLTKNQDNIRLFDPAGGTGNLITTVMDQLEKSENVYAGEVDPTLIKLAVMNANLQQKEIEFFHQDSLRPFLLDPVDLVVSDLPVGYYPDDAQASNYELKADEGNSYAHHLFIEQSMTYTKPGGYLIFVIPEFLFNSDQSDKLHAYLQEKTHIVGVLRLPETLFKTEKNHKSILILQKKGENTQSLKQPLLVQVPSFKNTEAMDDIMSQINAWFNENMYKS